MIKHWHLLAAALAVAAPVGAQTPVVVTPTDTHGWAATDQSGGGTAAITTTQPRNGDGSIEFNTSGSAGKAMFTQTVFTGFPASSLSDVTSAAFDWYRSSTSTQSGILTPAFHFLVSDQGTTSELVWEWAYQTGSVGNAPTDSWQSVNLAGQTNQTFWRSVYPGAVNGATNTACGNTKTDGGSQANWTLAQWADGSHCYSSSAMVYGVSVGDGSGWGDGTYQGFVDNVEYGIGSDAGTRYNFEVTSTPEPSSLALLGTGLFGLVPMIRRRKK